MNITFLGAAREVTGSCFRIETGIVRFLVDCGMVQGGCRAAARNLEPFAFDPRSGDFPLLTHADIEHSGVLRTHNRAGCMGPIDAAGATADLLKVMLAAERGWEVTMPESRQRVEWGAERRDQHVHE